MRIMDFIDRILKLLMDSRWHTIEEVEQKISVPSHNIHYALGFLQDQAFVNMENDMIIITPRGLKLMELQA